MNVWRMKTSRAKEGWVGDSERKINSAKTCFCLFSGLAVTWICQIINHKCYICTLRAQALNSSVHALMSTKKSVSRWTNSELTYRINIGFSSCLVMWSVWLSSTERRRVSAESGESPHSVGTGETMYKTLWCFFQITSGLNINISFTASTQTLTCQHTCMHKEQ